MKETETDSLQQSINEYRMPRANTGLLVLWYRNGHRDRTRVEVAYMLHAGERTATIYSLMSQRRVDVVRHVDDPKLQLNPEQRENGAWDFTDDYKAQHAFRESIEERISAMERQMARWSSTQPRAVGRPRKDAPLRAAKSTTQAVAAVESVETIV